MSRITFDIYHFVERLEKAGMPREQAVAFAEAQKESPAEALDSGLVTRGDLSEVKSELKADIVRLENRIETLDLRLTVKLGIFLSVAVGILIAVLRVSH